MHIIFKNTDKFMDFDLDQSKVSPGNKAANMAMLNRGTAEIPNLELLCFWNQINNLFRKCSVYTFKAFKDIQRFTILPQKYLLITKDIFMISHHCTIWCLICFNANQTFIQSYSKYYRIKSDKQMPP